MRPSKPIRAARRLGRSCSDAFVVWPFFFNLRPLVKPQRRRRGSGLHGHGKIAIIGTSPLSHDNVSIVSRRCVLSYLDFLSEELYDPKCVLTQTSSRTVPLSEELYDPKCVLTYKLPKDGTPFLAAFCKWKYAGFAQNAPYLAPCANNPKQGGFSEIGVFPLEKGGKQAGKIVITHEALEIMPRRHVWAFPWGQHAGRAVGQPCAGEGLGAPPHTRLLPQQRGASCSPLTFIFFCSKYRGKL